MLNENRGAAILRGGIKENTVSCARALTNNRRCSKMLSALQLLLSKRGSHRMIDTSLSNTIFSVKYLVRFVQNNYNVWYLEHAGQYSATS